MLASRHTPVFFFNFFLKCLIQKSFSLQFPVVIYNLLSLQPVLPCNLSSVSAFFSAKNSYNGYIKSSKFWFPFSLLSFVSNPSTSAFSTITTWTIPNLLNFTVCWSLCPVYHHPSFYFLCKALGDCFCVVCVWYQSQLSSRWCYCITVRVVESNQYKTLKHLK